jgi:hypothetical protein
MSLVKEDKRVCSRGASRGDDSGQVVSETRGTWSKVLQRRMLWRDCFDES